MNPHGRKGAQAVFAKTVPNELVTSKETGWGCAEMFSAAQPSCPVFLTGCGVGAHGPVQSVGDALATGLSCSGSVGWDSQAGCEPSRVRVAPRPLCLLLPCFCCCRKKIWILGRLKSDFCNSALVLFLWFNLRPAQLEVCLFTNVSLVHSWGFCPRAASLLSRVWAASFKSKLNHPLESSDPPQDSEGCIYFITCRFSAILVFNPLYSV